MMEADDETFIVVIPIMKVEMRRSAVMSVERKRIGRKWKNGATGNKLKQDFYRLMDTKPWASNASPPPSASSSVYSIIPQPCNPCVVSM